MAGQLGAAPVELRRVQPWKLHHRDLDAALLVQHSVTFSKPNEVLRYCESFDSMQVTGITLLQLAHSNNGLEYQAVDYGGSLGDAVCQIDYEPPTPANGFNTQNCLNTGPGYWGLFVSRGGGPWQPASYGASSENFGDGDAEGFSYGSAPPPPPSPAGVCPSPAPSSSTTSAPPTSTPSSNPTQHQQPPAPGAVPASAAGQPIQPAAPASRPTSGASAAASGTQTPALALVQPQVSPAEPRAATSTRGPSPAARPAGLAVAGYAAAGLAVIALLALLGLRLFLPRLRQ